jgi:hypothetical protein
MTAAKLRRAMAAMGNPETIIEELCAELGIVRQTLCRHVGPDGAIRPDGQKLLKSKGRESLPSISREARTEGDL